MNRRALLLTLVGAGALLIWLVYTVNRYVTSENAVEAAWAQVRNVQQRRIDLIPQLVTVTQAYAAHENAIVAELAAARAAYLNSEGVSSGVPQLTRVNAAVAKATQLETRYPALHQAELYRALAFEVAGSTNRIAIEERRYNAAVAAHRALLRSFPTRLFARSLTEPPFLPTMPGKPQ